jgi:hypothetical protein
LTYNTKWYILPSSIRREFIETTAFTKRVDREGAETLREIQTAILKNPEAGQVIQGTGGLRKIRVADASRGKGKRGGLRAIYLDVPGAGQTYLLALYDNGAKDDLSNEEKKTLRDLGQILKETLK